MKNLTDILVNALECDGACPGNTMGMGNPIAPNPETGEYGSGDVPNAKAKKQKSKRRYKDTHPDDKGSKIIESIFDVEDLGDDDVFKIGLDSCVENINKILNRRMEAPEYIKFVEDFRVICKNASIETKLSTQAQFRSKDFTIVSFMPDDPKKDITHFVEIRRFIKNPLPYALELYIQYGDWVYSRVLQRVNHPSTPVAMKARAEHYLLPTDFWEKLNVPYGYK